MILLGVLLGLAACVVFFLVRGSYEVDEGEVAVVTTFGVAESEPDGQVRTHGPGLHLRWPWQRVHKVAMKELTLDLSGDHGLSAMAEDGTLLRLDSILRYAPVRAGLRHFLFELEAPIEHVKGAFTCLLRNELANLKSSGPAADEGSYALIRRERKQLNARLEEACRGELGARYGVQFNAVDLTDILPPDELADALNAVMNARNGADAAFAIAQADAQRRVVAAARGVDIARARARAAEEEIDTLGQHLRALGQAGTLDGYVRRRRQEVLCQARGLYMKVA